MSPKPETEASDKLKNIINKYHKLFDVYNKSLGGVGNGKVRSRVGIKKKNGGCSGSESLDMVWLHE